MLHLKDDNNCNTSAIDSDSTKIKQQTLHGLKMPFFGRKKAKDINLDDAKFLFVNQLALDMKGKPLFLMFIFQAV